MYLPLAVAAPVAVWWTARLLLLLSRYARADRMLRPMLRRAWSIKAGWSRDARRVGLVQIDRSRPRWWSSPPTASVIEREMIPAIRVQACWWGVLVDARSVGRLGLTAFQQAAPHLADVWKVRQVRVEQPSPGLVRLRAIVRDPLTEPTPPADPHAIEGSTPLPLPTDPAVWHAGVDADGVPVIIRSSGVSGVVVAGLAGYGKTSFINARLVQLAPLPQVQWVLIDGKGGPDYDDLFARAWLCAKDDPGQVRDHLATVHRLMIDRQHTIRSVLGCKNMWQVGPSPAWPLVLVVIDEAHTFFNESKGTDAQSKQLDALARATTRLVEELIRKGRNVGIQVVLATQKATADAIPTKIRDNCQVAVSFAQRTSEAATAILGSDITAAPDEHPRRLTDPAYIGVASMAAAHRPGFTLIRTHHVPDELADRIAGQHAHLVRDPARLLQQQTTATASQNDIREDGDPIRQDPPAAFPSSKPVQHAEQDSPR
ncbi:hypothetical protein [Catenuloplanes nepalensis]|uniref:hypothetical protein n=1 Tax=Catenuloplanes nepalensis TaxID=587533 RepID=UPI003521815F